MAFDPQLLWDAWCWWNRTDGVAPWAESNQGLISVLALVAALALALFEQKRALAAEARAHRAAEEAKAEAAAEARETAITNRLATLAEFAVAARGILRDAEHALQEDLQTTRDFMFDLVGFDVPGEKVRDGARASIGTLNALLAAARLSPNLIRATRDGVAALHSIGDHPTTVTDETYQAVYAAWGERLSAAGRAITDAEIELVQRLRPSPPAQPPGLTDETGFGAGHH